MRPSRFASAFLLLAAFSCAAPAAPTTQPAFPPPPRLATTPAELAAVKAAPDFPAVREAAAKAADPLLAAPVPLPEGSGSWVFYYACPDDGTTLRMKSLAEHECPQCHKVYGDDRTVAAYRGLMHEAAELAAIKLAWAYAYTGDTRYAQGVKRILLKLADDYHTYPDRLDRWGHTGMFAPLGGRRYVQSLDEAVGAVRLGEAYDLTRTDPAWTDAERKHAEDDFFRPTAETLLRFNQDINNHQTWYNAGLVSIASVLGDAALVDRVMTMKGGVRYQLEKSIGSDGLWYEGSMAYHNYALQPMVKIADATRRLGIGIHEDPKLKLMITGPLRAAYPDGTFPVINDSDPADWSMFGWAFEWGWKTFKDPLLAQAAARGDEAKLHTLMGPEAKTAWPPALPSEALPDAGLVMLRSGGAGQGADASCVCLDYGPHGGGHGHYDKLSLTLFTGGREWLLDPGRLTYSHKEYQTWVKHTAAHNTVAIDGKSQTETTGKLLWLSSGDAAGVPWSACAAESDGAYPGAVLRRCLLLTPGFLLDVFDVESKDAKQIDLFAHAQADSLAVERAMSTREPMALGDRDGYPHLTEAVRWGPAQGEKPWVFKAGEKTLTATVLAPPGEEAFTAYGIGYRVDQKTPTLVRRVKAPRARFVTVYQVGSRSDHAIQGIKAPLDPGQPATVEFTEVAPGVRLQWSVEMTAKGITKADARR